MAGRRKKPPPKPRAGELRQLDRELAKRARAKRQKGDTPSQDEIRALRRVTREEEREARWEYYRTIPKGDWVAMSGRQPKVLNEQADRYGLPIGGRTIELPAVVRRLHDFLAENKHALARASGEGASQAEDPLLVGEGSVALERYRDEKAKIARIDRLERERKLIDRDEVHSRLAHMATLLKRCGETLERQAGAAARTTFDRTLEEIGRIVEEFDGGDDIDAEDA